MRTLKAATTARMLTTACALVGALGAPASHAGIPALAGAATGTAAALGGPVRASASTVRFTSSEALLAGPNLEGGMHSCQPLRGDLATVTGDGVKLFGSEMMPVQVNGGRCDGATGWVGVQRIEALPANGPAVADVVRFAASDVLLSEIEPAPVRAECQPLRGDQAEIAGVMNNRGILGYHVRIVSGRCKDTIGWVGASRIER